MQLNIDIYNLIDICIPNVCINMNQPEQIAVSQFGILPWNTNFCPIKIQIPILGYEIEITEFNADICSLNTDICILKSNIWIQMQLSLCKYIYRYYKYRYLCLKRLNSIQN